MTAEDKIQLICSDYTALIDECKLQGITKYWQKDIDIIEKLYQEIQDLKDTVEYVEKNKDELENVYRKLMEQNLASLEKENDRLQSEYSEAVSLYETEGMKAGRLEDKVKEIAEKAFDEGQNFIKSKYDCFDDWYEEEIK